MPCLAAICMFACPCTAFISLAVAQNDHVLDVLEAHDEYVYTISFSEDRRMMATAAGDNTAIIWDLDNWKPRHVLEHDAAVYAAAVSPDGKLIATATGEGVVSLWDADAGSRIIQKAGHQDAVYCVVFSPDGKRIASAGGSTDGGDTVCRIWQVDGLKLEQQLAGHERQVYGLAFSPDGTSIASGSSDKMIRIWDIETGVFETLKRHSSDVYRCRFSPDGTKLASVGQDGEMLIHDLRTGEATELFKTSRKQPLYGVEFSADGKLLGEVGDDYRLRIWRQGDMQLILEQKVARKALYAIAFGPGDDNVMVAGEDGDLYLLAIPTR